MGILDAIHTGLTELLSHKMRSLLTMLGVVFGVAAVIAMVSIGEGAKQEALRQIRLMGIDVVHVRRAPLSGELADEAWDKSPNGLKYSDAQTIREICEFAEEVIPMREIFANVTTGEKPASVTVIGTTPEYEKVARINMESGRFLDSGDTEERHAVCVIGSDAKRELFGFDDAIGESVKIGSYLFRVVGIIEPKEVGTLKEFSNLKNINSNIYIPLNISLTDFQIASREAMPIELSKIQEIVVRRMQRKTLGNTSISEIIIKVKDESAAAPTAALLDKMLLRRHNNMHDYELIVPSELLKQSQQTQRIFNIVMAAIAGISLLVGGIGIMNIMLATVTQRTREIGIRRCVGATQWDITRQFMLEALVITCVGGLIGILLGVGGARAISVYANWTTVVSVQAIVISFGVSALVGIVFGLYPAMRAASVDPIEALRYG